MSSYPTSAELSRRPPGQPTEPDLCLKPFASGRSEWALLGESVAVRRLRSQIRRVAPYFRTGLIRGEAGAGKELVARAIHAQSSGADGPFVVADACALAESVDRGAASTGVDALSAEEVLESAVGGTLYLTPVGRLSFRHQAALARLLRAGEEHRGGGAQPGCRPTQVREWRPIDGKSATTRILAASDCDLRTLVAIGQFRQDLYGRLSALEIFVPPLRQRIEDIPGLVEGLLRRLAEESGMGSRLLTESAVSLLQRHSWPNNLRELEGVVAHAAALAEGGVIEARHLPGLAAAGPAEPAATSNSKIERLHDVMQHHVLDVLTRCGGNKVRAAELLGISRSTLYRMLHTGSGSERCA
jgi:DNA-binding NtrC family response regulator